MEVPVELPHGVSWEGTFDSGYDKRWYAAGPGGGTTDFSIWGIVQKMGATTIFLHMVLAALALFSLAIVVERSTASFGATIATRALRPKLLESLRCKNFEEAAWCAEQYARGHLAAVVKAGLERARQGDCNEGGGEAAGAVSRALDREVAIQALRIRRGLWALAAVGATAPLIGLLGATLDVMEALDWTASSEAAGLGALAGAIAEALIPAAMGILLGVAMMWAHRRLQTKAEHRIAELDVIALEVRRCFLRPNQGSEEPAVSASISMTPEAAGERPSRGEWPESSPGRNA